jgi:hypothetical protein
MVALLDDVYILSSVVSKKHGEWATPKSFTAKGTTDKNNTETQHAKKRAKRGIQRLSSVARSSPYTSLGAVLGGLDLGSGLAIHSFAVKL